jgi:hypothetical protein
VEAPVAIPEILKEIAGGAADIKKRPSSLDFLDGLRRFAKRPLAANKPFEAGVGHKLGLEVLKVRGLGSRLAVKQAVVATANDLCRTLAGDENFCIVLQAEGALDLLRLIVHESPAPAEASCQWGR